MEKKVRYYDPRTGRSGELILLELPEIPEKLSELENDEGFSKRLSELTNDAGFVTAAQAAAAAPVQSVNGETGAVVLDASDVGALPDTYVAPVQSVNGQTGAVNTRAYDFSFVGTSDFAGQVDTALSAHGAGSYTFVIPSGADNGMPSNTYWYGLIQCTSASNVQVICWGNTNAAEAPTYRRAKLNGTWSSWVRVHAPGPVYSAVSSSTVSVASGTDTVIKSVTLAPGVYVFSFGASFASNETGSRAIAVSTTTSVSSAPYTGGQKVRALSGETTWVTLTNTFQITVQTTFYCLARQNSGSALNVTGAYRYIKLA